MTEPKNGSQLINYRLAKMEDAMTETRREMVKLHTEHETRIRQMENFVTREGASGVPLKTVYLVAGIIATVVGGVISAVFKFAGVI